MERVVYMLSKIRHKIIQTTLSEWDLIKYRNENTINVKFYSDILNWGDVLNIEIVGYVAKAKVINCTFGHRKHLLAIGSVLQPTNEKSVIWGSGFLQEDQIIKKKPIKVCAVRGPKSQKMLREQGVECPEIFGDPALLLPEIYNPKRTPKKFKLGVVPHYEQKNSEWLKKIQGDKDIKIIDIQQQGVKTFVDDIIECETIASSSLHGIVAADAYNIPNCRLMLTRMNSFKFDDYHQGIGVDDYNVVEVFKDNSINKQEVLKNCQLKDIKFDADKLKNAFPYDLVVCSSES